MKTYQVALKPVSAITSIPASDTLFGAICWGIRLLYGEKRLEEMLTAFAQGEPSFLVSSSFPVSASKIRFFPKPKSRKLPPSSSEDISKLIKSDSEKKALFETLKQYKAFSKAVYLSEGLFTDLLLGKANEEVLFKGYIESNVVKKDSLLVKKEELSELEDALKKEEVRIRTNIDRVSLSTSGEGQMFHTETTIIGGGFSLFFLLKTDNIEFLEPLIGKDKFLSDHGVGGERNVGLNQYRFSVEEIQEIKQGQGKAFVTLSRYIPQKDEIDANNPNTCYDVLPIVSKVDNSYSFQGKRFIKDRVFCMKEGSAFEAIAEKEFYGRIISVCEIDGVTIYQNGIAFPLFMNT
jgi:CRISPR-associated protein Csm4